MYRVLPISTLSVFYVFDVKWEWKFLSSYPSYYLLFIIAIVVDIAVYSCHPAALLDRSSSPILASMMTKLTPLVQSHPIFTAREIGRKIRGVFNAA